MDVRCSDDSVRGSDVGVRPADSDVRLTDFSGLTVRHAAVRSADDDAMHPIHTLSTSHAKAGVIHNRFSANRVIRMALPWTEVGV